MNTPTPSDIERAARTLNDFVNDHNETVRWLRNQSPFEVAEALATALSQERERVKAKVREAIRRQAKDFANTHQLSEIREPFNAGVVAGYAYALSALEGDEANPQTP